LLGNPSHDYLFTGWPRRLVLPAGRHNMILACIKGDEQWRYAFFAFLMLWEGVKVEMTIDIGPSELIHNF
jgi:hypothetical protein